jgi:hypothetical protein
MMKERHTSTQLHDQVNLCPLINHLIQAHYSGVVKVCQDVYFRLNGFLGFNLPHILLFVGFERKHCFCLLVCDSAHDSEGALTYLQTDFEVLKVKKLHFLCFPFLLDEIFKKSQPF